MPPNPSRVDRLIVDSAKEYIKVANLIARIENLNDTIFYPSIQQTFQKWFDSIMFVNTKRKEELVNNANKQRMTGQQSRVNYNDDKGKFNSSFYLNANLKLNPKFRCDRTCKLDK